MEYYLFSSTMGIYKAKYPKHEKYNLKREKVKMNPINSRKEYWSQLITNTDQQFLIYLFKLIRKTNKYQNNLINLENSNL